MLPHIPKPFKTAKNAYDYVFFNGGLVLKTILILIAGSLISGFLYFAQLSMLTEIQDYWLYNRVYSLLYLVITSYFFAVCFMGWSRCTLIDASDKQFPKIHNPDARFLFFWKAFFILTFLIEYIPGTVSSLLLSAYSPDINDMESVTEETAHVIHVIRGLLAGSYFVLKFLIFSFVCRYFLILPARAVGKKWTFKMAAHASKGFRFKIFLSYIIVILPLNIIIMLLALFLGLDSDIVFISDYFTQGIGLALTAFVISQYFLWHHKRVKANKAPAKPS